MFNKTFLVERKGRLQWIVIRQAPHDPQYGIGSRIPGCGKVVAMNREYATEAAANPEILREAKILAQEYWNGQAWETLNDWQRRDCLAEAKSRCDKGVD